MTTDDLTIVILRQLQSDLSELKRDCVRKSDLLEFRTEVQTELQVMNERLANIEHRNTIQDAQRVVERRNDFTHEQRIDAEIKDLQARVTRLENEQER